MIKLYDINDELIKRGVGITGIETGIAIVDDDPPNDDGDNQIDPNHIDDHHQNDKTNGDNDNYDDLTPPNDGTKFEEMEEVEQLEADQTNYSSNYPNFHM